jgi:hypothetical protein
MNPTIHKSRTCSVAELRAGLCSQQGGTHIGNQVGDDARKQGSKQAGKQASTEAGNRKNMRVKQVQLQ